MAEIKFLDNVGLTHLLEKINSKFSKIGHTHTKAEITDFAHTHDDRYYTESEVDSKLSGKAASSHKHGAGDITSVNASAISGVIAAANLPSFVDDVLEGYYGSDGVFYKNHDASSGKYSDAYTGEAGKIYVDFNTNKTYRWGGSAYVVVSETIALGETASTAYRGDRGKAAYDHAAAKGSAFASGLYKITTNAQGHVTAATAVQKSDITALGIPAQDTNTWNALKGATTSAAGLAGYAPAPANGQQGYFLRGDGAWAAISKGTVGLGNVDNTADSAKSVKYATSAGSASTATKASTADSATKATQDSAGQQINTTYIKGLSVSGRTITYTKGDGTTGTITTQDTNTWNALKGATTSAAGLAGYAPAPANGQQGYFLRGDGAWAAISKGTVGLGNVDNTADSAKSVKYATSAGSASTATKASTADSATKATQDSAGQQINTTYIKGLSVSGRTITYTKGDGTTGTITTQDTNTTYNALTNDEIDAAFTAVFG